MSQAGPVALPRGGPVFDSRYPLGGQNGTVALPSRMASVSGQGTPEEPSPKPPIGGQHGAVVLFRALFSLLVPRTPLDMPRGLPVTFYDRKFHPNIYPLMHYSQPPIATTSWTADAREDAPTPTAPIPHDRRYWAWTWRREYDTKIYSIYFPHERPQPPQHLRKILQGEGYQMLMPYFARLTQLKNARTYGSTTPVLSTPPDTTFGVTNG